MYFSKFARGFFVAATMAGCLYPMERASGADWDSGGPPAGFNRLPDDRVNFASNWYVRGDLAYAAETFPKISSVYTGDLLNPQTIAPGYTFNPSGSPTNTFSAGAGFGYKINNWLRTDLVLDYRSPAKAAWTGPQIICTTQLQNFTPPALPNGVQPPPQVVVTATDNCSSHFNTDIHRWDLLANAYVDLGTWGGFTPYVGAGAGVAWAYDKESVNWTQSNGLPYQVTTDGFFFDYDRSITKMTYQFAWTLMAGVAFQIAEQAQLDVGYRFLDLGNVSGVSAVTGAQVTKSVYANEVRAGLRYTID